MRRPNRGERKREWMQGGRQVVCSKLWSFVEHASAGQAQKQTISTLQFLYSVWLSLKIVQREKIQRCGDTGGITRNPQFGGNGLKTWPDGASQKHGSNKTTFDNKHQI